jgi:hypothetical protein
MNLIKHIINFINTYKTSLISFIYFLLFHFLFSSNKELRLGSLGPINKVTYIINKWHQVFNNGPRVTKVLISRCGSEF